MVRAWVGVIGLVLAVRAADAAPVESAPQATPNDSDARTVAVLKRFPHNYEAQDALAALRAIPGWAEAVEKVIRSGPPEVRPVAMAVAGRTRDPRFFPSLRERLESIAAPPGKLEDWINILDVTGPVSALRTPEAAAAMHAFWKRVGMKVQPTWRRVILKDRVAGSLWSNSARRELVNCADTILPVGADRSEQRSIGTKSPGVDYGIGAQRRWVAICEARQDDDGNGQLNTYMLRHGDTRGDLLRPYLVLGSGAGTEIDDLVAGDSAGKWVVFTKDMCVHLVNTLNGQTTVLKGADGRPGDPVVGAHRAARFSPDGNHLLFLRTNGDRTTVVHRDLRSGQDRLIDPGPGEFHQAFFEASGRFAVMELVVKDTDGDGHLRTPQAATTLSDRRCRAGFLSASMFGEFNDKPIQRVVALTGAATVKDAPSGITYSPAPMPESPDELAPETPASEHDFKAPIARGPFRWRRRP
jgi:hypothetical protein